MTTLSGTEWPEAVATLQSDVSSEGRALSLCVRDEDTYACAPCGTYTLAFDEAGAQAFRVDACDPRTGASTVTLVDRSALFDHGHVVPRPRAITVRAAIVSSIETSGGAASTGGSALGCTARVRPYLRDLEHGTDVYLGPDQYDVRVLHAAVEASAVGSGWMLASESRIDSDVDYEVIERASGESVMTGHASRECASQTLATIDAGRAVRDAGTVIPGDGFGSIATSDGIAGGLVSGSSLADGCNGHYPVAPQHRFVVDGAVRGIELHAEGGGGDLTLAVRTAEVSGTATTTAGAARTRSIRSWSSCCRSRAPSTCGSARTSTAPRCRIACTSSSPARATARAGARCRRSSLAPRADARCRACSPAAW